MTIRRTLALFVVAIALPLQAAATDLVLPMFALNAELTDGRRQSTELYLVNPGTKPVQVGISAILPGRVRRPTPCGEFMSPTRVIPPQSAVVWTASGLATDLGCADEALGALELRSDGPIRISGRLVTHGDDETTPNLGVTPQGVLSGAGQVVEAVAVNHLPGPTTLLVPALLWHRNPCGSPDFTTNVAFANPGSEPVTATLYVPSEAARAIRVNGRIEALPHHVVIEAGRWKRLDIAPLPRHGNLCLEPESFDLEVVIDGPLAVIGTVFDRAGGDGRTVRAVDLERD
jgi:hypothetical protein